MLLIYNFSAKGKKTVDIMREFSLFRHVSLPYGVSAGPTNRLFVNLKNIRHLRLSYPKEPEIYVRGFSRNCRNISVSLWWGPTLFLRLPPA